jgi:hypothetical protein
MVKLQTLIFILLLIILCACQAQVEQGALPTLVDFPTATETFTPSATFTPTITATATNTPTSTATFTPTQTFTPSNTPTATVTKIPSATATSSQTFTPTATDTPPASPTPIPTRTPETPIIEIFQANDTTVSPNDAILLRWVVQADTVKLETIQNNVVIQTQDVPLIGTFSTNAPTTNGQIIFRLTASRAGLEARSTTTIEVGPRCTLTWFFQNAPQNIGCPLSPSAPSLVSFQQFQEGFMFRAGINGSNRVCGVQVLDNVYSCYAYQPYLVIVPPISPPSGFFPPMPEVAYSFYNDLATGGFWVDEIGWGINAGASNNSTTQVGENGRIYIQLPNGIYSFDSSLTGLGGQFQRVP